MRSCGRTTSARLLSRRSLQRQSAKQRRSTSGIGASRLDFMQLRTYSLVSLLSDFHVELVGPSIDSV
eukprot:2495469-Amphidinium_carterae.2